MPKKKLPVKNSETQVSEISPKEQAIIVRMKAVEWNCQVKSKEFVLLRFEQGCIIHEIMSESQGYDGTVKRVAQAIGMTPQYLNRLHTWAGFFNYNKKALESDMKGKPNVTVTYYLKEFANDENEKAVGGRAEVEKNLLKKFEQGVQAYETLKEKYPESDEAKGVEAKFVEIVQEDVQEEQTDAKFLIGDVSKAAPIGRYADENGKKIKDAEYLAWGNTQKCCVTGAYPAEMHHLRQKGRDGENACDYLAVPMEREVHRLYHKVGFDEFCSKEYQWKHFRNPHAIDLLSEPFRHLKRYMDEIRRTPF